MGKEEIFFSARFYNKNYRSELHIQIGDISFKNADLYVVMMNPGSSKPYSDSDALQPCVEDPTQLQIVRLMKKLNRRFAKVINLSDYRCPRSSVFLEKIKKLPDNHSIFCKTRSVELKNILHDGSVEIVCAWGLNSKLTHLAKQALVALKDRKLYGYPRNNLTNKPLFRHPLPRKRNLQEEWVDQMEFLIKNKIQIKASEILNTP